VAARCVGVAVAGECPRIFFWSVVCPARGCSFVVSPLVSFRSLVVLLVFFRLFLSGLVALPTCTALHLSRAEQLELAGDMDSARAAYENLVTTAPSALAYVHFMRFVRRVDGASAARKAFARCRKDSGVAPESAHITFIAAAHIEYFLNKESRIARKVFELGAFLHCPSCALWVVLAAFAVERGITLSPCACCGPWLCLLSPFTAKSMLSLRRGGCFRGSWGLRVSMRSRGWCVLLCTGCCVLYRPRTSHWLGPWCPARAWHTHDRGTARQVPAVMCSTTSAFVRVDGHPRSASVVRPALLTLRLALRILLPSFPVLPPLLHLATPTHHVRSRGRCLVLCGRCFLRDCCSLVACLLCPCRFRTLPDVFCVHSPPPSPLRTLRTCVGLKYFPKSVDFAMEYIDFLWNQNDNEYLKVVFERILTSLPSQVRSVFASKSVVFWLCLPCCLWRALTVLVGLTPPGCLF